MNSASLFLFFFRTSIYLFAFSLAPDRIDQWIQITTLQMLYGPRFHHPFMNTRHFAWHCMTPETFSFAPNLNIATRNN